MRIRQEPFRLQLRYQPATDAQPAPNVFVGGVRDPEHQSELALTDEDAAVHLYTTARSAFELGRYFVALSRFDGPDPGYHDHFDALGRVINRAGGVLLVYGPPPLTGEPTRVTDEEIDVELAYFEDEKAKGVVDGSGPVPPRNAEELTVAVEPRIAEPDDEIAGDAAFTVSLRGSRAVYRALGLYLIALSRFTPRAAGYYDTLDTSGRALAVHLG
jgi:hypothetical protein